MKSMFLSKTFWTNLIAFAGMVYQNVSGNVMLLDLEIQASILAVINIILRSVTKAPVTWK
jgi:hypothetical protein